MAASSLPSRIPVPALQADPLSSPAPIADETLLWYAAWGGGAPPPPPPPPPLLNPPPGGMLALPPNAGTPT